MLRLSAAFANFFSTEEKKHIILEAQKNEGNNGIPAQNPVDIDNGFPLRPVWDYNTGESRDHLRVYVQTLMAGLWAAIRQLTNLAKVYDVRQEANENPAIFLEGVRMLSDIICT